MEENNVEQLHQSLQHSAIFEFGGEGVQQGGEENVNNVSVNTLDWSHIGHRQWGNIPPILCHALTTITNQLRQNNAKINAVMTNVDSLNNKVKLIEQNVTEIKTVLSEMTNRTEDNARGLNDARQDHRAELILLRRQVNEMLTGLEEQKVASERYQAIPEEVRRLRLQMASLYEEDMIPLKGAVARAECRMDESQTMMERLQDEMCSIPLSLNGRSQKVSGGTGRSVGRWLWKGSRLLSSRSKLIPWDIRTHESGDALHWLHNKNSHVIEVSRGGIYKFSFGAFTTNSSSVLAPAMTLYINDDAFLSVVHSNSFVGKKSTTTGGALLGKMTNSIGKCCSVPGCEASCYTGLTTSDYVYVPARSLICVCYSSPANEVVAGFLEIQEFV